MARRLVQSDRGLSLVDDGPDLDRYAAMLVDEAERRGVEPAALLDEIRASVSEQIKPRLRVVE